MESSSLQIHNLITDLDCEKYKQFLSLINIKNPFFRLELVITPETNRERLKYFVFSIGQIPKILMLFYLRPIEINGHQTDYFDVISPYGYSGPIYDRTLDSKTIIEFWKYVDSWYQNNDIISEFIRFSLNNNCINYSGSIISTLYNVKGLLLNEKSQWKNFKKKVRNNIRKAIDNGLEFEIWHNNIGERTILEFYEIYTSTLRRKNAEKRYYYSLDYFQNLISKNPDCCILAFVRKENIAISTELLLLSNDDVYSFLGGTIANYFTNRPNDFLKYNVMNWARSFGYKSYILGGGQKNNDTLYRYKKSFFPADDDVIFKTGRKIMNASVYYNLACQLNSNPEISKSEALNISKGFFPKYRKIN